MVLSHNITKRRGNEYDPEIDTVRGATSSQDGLYGCFSAHIGFMDALLHRDRGSVWIRSSHYLLIAAVT